MEGNVLKAASRKNTLVRALPLLAVLLIFGTVFSEESEAARQDCVGCHKEYQGLAYGHKGMSKGCGTCHTDDHGLEAPYAYPKGSKPFGLDAAVPELCVDCHKETPYKELAHPGIKNSCSSCHDPHGSNYPGLLVRLEADLCYSCHEGSDFTRTTLHVPISKGCSKCHEPHIAKFPGMLRQESNALCFSCHEQKGYMGQVGHRTPENTNCADCHAPHSTDIPHLLTAPYPNLCYECHKEHASKTKHGPIREGKCDTCHAPHATDVRMLLKADGPDLCFSCHADHTTKRTVHKPVTEGKCFSCHNAHESGQPFLLKEGVQTLCFTCHDRKIVQADYVHGPAAAGACAICHLSHESDEPSLLMGPVNEICFSCHEDKAEEMERKHPHKPAKESCAKCHNPHASNFPYTLLAEKNKALCGKCHAKKLENIAKATVRHGALNQEKECLSCHTPHASEYPRQLNQQPIELCFGCHNKTIEKDGKEIMDIKSYIQASKILHGPIKQGDCSSCHNTHGSDNFRMLLKYFPEKFYAPYEPKNYGLCFNCHANTLVDEQYTTTLTGFRNGKENLHYVHVHKEEKGRTCRACHDAHGTNNPRHIRDAVPFGGWPLPVGFTKNETGGRCAPGCHQAFGYDRERRVKNRK